MTEISKRARILIALFCSLACGGCAGSTSGEPAMSPAAENLDYASQYPESVQYTVDRFQSELAKLDKTLGELPKSAEQLQDANKESVLEVIDAADEAGRSEAYAREVQNTAAARRFFEEEKPHISRRVGGTTNYHAKKLGCDIDFYGVAAGALNQVVDKRIEERLHDRNPAQLLIDDRRDALSTKQAQTLEQLADSITHASHAIHVGLERQRRDLAQLADQGESVHARLEAEIERLEELAANGDKKSKATQAQQARLEKYKASLEQVSSQAEAARRASTQAEEAVTQWKDRYAAALDRLRSDVENAPDPKESTEAAG